MGDRDSSPCSSFLNSIECHSRRVDLGTTVEPFDVLCLEHWTRPGIPHLITGALLPTSPTLISDLRLQACSCRRDFSVSSLWTEIFEFLVSCRSSRRQFKITTSDNPPTNVKPLYAMFQGLIISIDLITLWKILTTIFCIAMLIICLPPLFSIGQVPVAFKVLEKEMWVDKGRSMRRETGGDWCDRER